jgi:N-methylhydantoinase A
MPDQAKSREPGILIGCDTGGTFTDFVMHDPGQSPQGLRTLKLSSTPDDPSRAILEGLRLLAQERPLQELCHATTVATNALLEGTLGKVGYLVTEGFADSLWLGRGERSELYALRPGRKSPPLARQDVFEVKERVGAQGQVVRALEEQELERLREALQGRSDLQALAVCLLHATLCPQHELVLESALESGVPLFVSHRVAAGPGEYERGMTTLLAAALAPKVDEYLARLEGAIAGTRLWIVHSAGGLLLPDEARLSPHRLALSGPAAGLRGALSLAQTQGMSNIITLDVGGTSSDVALCHDGELPYTWESDIEGYPLLAPSLEIHTIGAGGGSIAFSDAGGLLRVGPRSAGAQPGPACYGRGGKDPTVTDALCWAGFLPADLGSLALDTQASEVALRRLGSSLGLSVDETAQGILAIAVNHLGLALRKVSTGRGLDPHDFTLLPFGGAGPMLCCQVAESLEMSRILVPASAGVLSAWGALTAPWEREWAAPLPAALRTDQDAARRLQEELRDQVVPPLEETSVQPLVARRYRGQGDTLVSAPEVDFHDLHLERFGFQRRQAPVETVEVRWRCRGQQRFPQGGLPAPEPWRQLGARSLLSDQGRIELPVFSGSLGVGQRHQGPFLRFSSDSTLYVAPGWSAEGTSDGHLLLTCTVNAR